MFSLIKKFIHIFKKKKNCKKGCDDISTMLSTKSKDR